MGCLTLSVIPVPTHNVRIIAGSNYSCAINAESRNVAVTLGGDAVNDIPVIHFQRIGGAGVTAALVCRTSLGDTEFLYVTDGVLMVTDGYLRVIKDGREGIQT